MSTRSIKRVWGALAFGVWAGTAVAGEPQAQAVNAQAQERVALLIQDALGPFRNVDESPSAAGTNAMRNLMKMEASFRTASALMPARLDLRFGIASALVLQAIHTNSQFEFKIQDALRVYQEIHALDTNGFEASILYAAYTRATGETNLSEATIKELLAVHPQRTREYVERFRRADEILQMPPNEEADRTMPTNRDHAIVVLGAALDTNGVMKPKLLGRLQQGLKLATLYPEAPVILTGGNQKNGITEARVMGDWLLQEGVCADRLYIEDRARDTLGNAVFSASILRKLGVSYVTLVTSITHIHRGLADLQEACLQRGLWLTYANLAAGPEPELQPGRERVAVYRDVMRASGLWAFPGVQP